MQLWGSVLATGGNLVFAGGTADRMFRAFDARDGKLLWQVRTNSGVTGVPTSFEVGGVQYIAVQSGWGVDAAHAGQAGCDRSEHVALRNPAGRRGLGVRASPVGEPVREGNHGQASHQRRGARL